MSTYSEVVVSLSSGDAGNTPAATIYTVPAGKRAEVILHIESTGTSQVTVNARDIGEAGSTGKEFKFFMTSSDALAFTGSNATYYYTAKEFSNP